MIDEYTNYNNINTSQSPNGSLKNSMSGKKGRRRSRRNNSNNNNSMMEGL